MTSPTLPPVTLPFRVADLPNRKPTRFALSPEPAVRAAMAAELGLLGLPDFTLKGELRPVGRNDFELEARLDAVVVQPCSISLVPVTTRLSEDVRRRYDADYRDPEGDEVELPEDDTTEALPAVIDIGTVALEALALALPLYPRAPGAELAEAVFAAPGVTPIRDEDLRPFAGLAALKSKLEGGGGSGENGGGAK